MRRGVLWMFVLLALTACGAAGGGAGQPQAAARPQPTAPAEIPAYADLPQGKTAEGYYRLGSEDAARELVVYGDYL